MADMNPGVVADRANTWIRPYRLRAPWNKYIYVASVFPRQLVPLLFINLGLVKVVYLDSGA